MVTQVQKAIDEAKAQAANTAQAVAIVPQTNNAVAAYKAPAKKLGLDDLSSGLNVDGFLQSKFEGLIIKSNSEQAKGASIIEVANVRFTIGDGATADVQTCEAGKYGDPAVYIKTYDMEKEVRGGSWEAAVAKGKLADPDKFYTYKSADLSMTLIEDLKDIKGKVVADKGQKLGNSVSATGMKNFRNFVEAVKKAGLLDAEIEVKITNEPKNAKGKTWGVLQFELIGEYVPDAE